MNENWLKMYQELYRSEDFDPDFYQRNYPDVFMSGLSPLEHYCKYGKKIGRLPNATRAKSIDTILSKQTHRAPDRPIKLSVICTTFNHVSYIRDTLEGFVQQKTNFEYEVLISDDCSTDGTTDVIAEYARRYEFIKHITREKNFGSSGNMMDLAARVRSEYVAICEGDDYWTDPDKLQIQVDYLDRHPTHSLCFHPVYVRYEDSPGRVEVFPNLSPEEYTLDRLARSNFIQTNSVMYRWRYRDGLPAEFEHVQPGDWYMHLMHAEVGRIGFIDRNMGVYRKHAGGMWANAVKNPIDLHIKYGPSELRMFEAVKSHFGGSFDGYMREKQAYIAREILMHFIAGDDMVGLADFIYRSHPLESMLLELFGIHYSNDLELSVEKIESLLRAAFKVSVIVTTYNHAEHLRQCLDSILLQRGAFALEIIIGDDCSTDNSQDIISEYIELYPEKIRQVRSKNNIGMLRNLRRCFAAASNPFIAICEGDDYWLSPFKLAKQLCFLSVNNSCSMVFNWLLLEDERNKSLIPHYDQGLITTDRIGFEDLVHIPLTANFSACLYRASTVKSIPASYYEKEGAADWLFNLYSAKNGQVGFIKELMSVYRIHGSGQWSGMSSEEKLARINSAKADFRQIFCDEAAFDSKEITLSVTDVSTVENLEFIGCLDYPSNGKTIFTDMGTVTMSGWAVTKIGAPVDMLVEYDGKIKTFPTFDSRQDATEWLRRHRHIDTLNNLCGFSIKVPFSINSSIRLGVRIHGKPRWWKIICGMTS